ncbi:50S ribosomal protein L24e [Halolamina sediminis]|jgi:large subunit ribosomal protein L24e|uniref:50S ribosomal protein L24e n=1 Tax=Halolamina sediminis TaxID=1480675 RepID=UPI0006B63749
MPQNRTCDYCGDDVEPGTGTMFVHTNGSVVHYCSAKCEKNADLGREPRDLEWTEEGGDHGVEVEETEPEEEAEEAVEEEADEAEEEAESEADEEADEAEADADEEDEE